MPEYDKPKELAMMTTPADWPVWPFLPLKRVGGNWELGFLIEDKRGVQPLVFVGNMLTREVTEQLLFDSFDSLYESGWRVD